ncbi:cytochrome P450 [Saccharopolyspora hattusasensis]|uniref:cytochrome P450 n=1 Tax=Saccharopolyspora hattusasensis TaxID=1128679 RepID=UPI003D995C94
MTTTGSSACPYHNAVSDPTTIDAIASFRDVEEIFRSQTMAPFLHDGTEEFRAGTVRQIDGPEHRARRRVMGRLLRGQGDQRFRSEVLMPTIQRNLQRVLQTPSDDGVPRADMVLFARVAFFQLAAALIGLDGVDTLDDAEALRQASDPIQEAMRSWYMEGDRRPVMARGNEARDEFRARYFEPALERRIKLVNAATTPEAEAALPNDLLTLMARDLDPAWTGDQGLQVREAVTDFINAGTFSSSFTLVHSLDECLTWGEQQPDRADLLVDEKFLAQAVAEAVRLHPIVPLFYRTATEAVTLKSGRKLAAGEHVALDIGAANRDPDVFGPDADAFIPGRPFPAGVSPYGVAFGAGRHMCYGMPVVIGSDGVNGSHVQVLKALFSAGVRRDRDRPALRNDRLGRMNGLWDEYPIEFTLSGRGA